ncbi:MAG: Pr6Pr family membrane protein, partial [Dermatophilaceae bacterium]
GVDLTAVPWDNTVLHYIVPVAMLVDYLLDRPRRRLSFRASLLWLIYPLAYAGYSLIRGAIVDWYPYPFLDPGTN